MSRQSIVLLGSTGSIGESTLQVVREHAKRFRVTALAAAGDIDTLRRQIDEFEPQAVALADRDAAEKLATILGRGAPTIYGGAEGVSSLFREVDCDHLVNAIVGAAGLQPTLEAIGNVPRICLANKETLVAAGEVVMDSARSNGTEIIPIDSEHSAIHQCLEGHRLDRVARLILTASGGPFRKWNADEIAGATVQDALNHPTWKMGKKVTVDSATLMNKGLELIEAMHLFGVPADQLGVVVHPQSVIHSMIEFSDGSLLAQLGETDMKHPIRYALSYPDRLSGGRAFNLADSPGLTFEEADLERFPCLALGFKAAREGGTSATVLNAANEVAVRAFLEESIPFGEIPTIIKDTMKQIPNIQSPELPQLLKADLEARSTAAELVQAGNFGDGAGRQANSEGRNSRRL